MALLERDAELAAVAAVVSAGGVVLVEGGAGIGKTALLDAACAAAAARGSEVLRARCAELEAGFAFGAVRQLFERRLHTASPQDRARLLGGPAGAAWALLEAPPKPVDASFAIVHGLYWVAANLAVSRGLVVAVDDAHWADPASLQWLGYVAPRVAELGIALLVAVRPPGRSVDPDALLAVRRQAAVIVRPRLLSPQAVGHLAHEVLGDRADVGLCARLADASGGNPFYLGEMLRATTDVDGLGAQDVLPHIRARLRRLGSVATRLAQAVAVLGDGCALHLAAALTGQTAQEAARTATALVEREVLAEPDPARFLHPILRDAVELSLDAGDRVVLHRAAAGLLSAAAAPAGRIAAHLRAVPPAADAWVADRLREAAAAALSSGVPQEAADLLRRVWAEPPASEQRVAVLRELARADVTAGRGTAQGWLEEALARTRDPRERAGIALEVAQAHAALFRWADAVDVLERAVADLGTADPELNGRLQGRLVVAGLHDARRAAQVGATLHHLTAVSSGEAVTVARGMQALLTGRPAAEVATPLVEVLSSSSTAVTDWDIRAALLWCLVTVEAFDAVDHSLGPMLTELGRTGDARGLIAVHTAAGLLKLRLGALPDADSAAHIAQHVLQQGDFHPGLPFAVTVRADVAIEAGQLNEARALLELLPAEPGPPGVGTVLVPAAWGRLHLAAGRPAEAVAAFQTCAAMFGTEVWGMDVRDVGYLHARSGAATALLLLGDRAQACRLADAELADVRGFGAPRALGVALRTAGLAHGGEKGLGLLAESAAALKASPAVLERAKSLAELGAAQRRAGHRQTARDNLANALDLAARCGARPLAARVREELRAAGARPRREWRRGVESLTPTELRVATLATEDRTNREIAQSLYVTTKTVEGHLSRVYGKLEITGRGQLREALRGEKPGVATE